MWFIGVEVEQETSAPPPKKNPGSAPGVICSFCKAFGQSSSRSIELILKQFFTYSAEENS